MTKQTEEDPQIFKTQREKNRQRLAEQRQNNRALANRTQEN